MNSPSMNSSSSESSPQPAQHAMLVSAILGSKSIEISGFKAEGVALPWLRVASPEVSLEDGSTETIQRSYARRTHNVAVMRRLVITVASIALVLLGFLLAWATQRDLTGKPAQGRPLATSGQLDWSVTAVNADSLEINLVGVPIRVRPGELLPNGEVLGSTHPSKSAYVTSRSTVVVKDIQPAQQVQATGTQAAPTPSAAPSPVLPHAAGAAQPMRAPNAAAQTAATTPRPQAAARPPVLAPAQTSTPAVHQTSTAATAAAVQPTATP